MRDPFVVYGLSASRAARDTLLVVIAFGEAQIDDLAVVTGRDRAKRLECLARLGDTAARRTTARRVRARACIVDCRQSAAERSADAAYSVCASGATADRGKSYSTRPNASAAFRLSPADFAALPSRMSTFFGGGRSQRRETLVDLDRGVVVVQPSAHSASASAAASAR